ELSHLLLAVISTLQLTLAFDHDRSSRKRNRCWILYPIGPPGLRPDRLALRVPQLPGAVACKWGTVTSLGGDHDFTRPAVRPGQDRGARTGLPARRGPARRPCRSLLRTK